MSFNLYKNILLRTVILDAGIRTIFVFSLNHLIKYYFISTNNEKLLNLLHI